MTVPSATLLGDLQGQVRRLEDDLREQVGRLPELSARLESDYALAQKTERTAEPWTSWLDAQAAQAAVSWVLGCVFVRFCEDNNLTDKRWIAGMADASGDGLARAVDAQAAWIQANPRENERGWLREAFGWLRGTHAGSSLFPDTDFVWWWDISADAAADLLGFFRRRGTDGGLVHRFDSPDWDTRFLGDLYQDLSEAARKRYALLQTPEFVEEFILDLTLDPALDRFGLEGFRMIDPACGSGHFLLGAFHRIFTVWTEQQPGSEVRQRVQWALDSVHGVDINAAATAIAKFRLTVAALRATGASGLDSPDAPAFQLHVATGDSLIWAVQGRQTHVDVTTDRSHFEHLYAWEDIDQHPGILRLGSYHAVVANPPYITVKDQAQNQAYRDRYETCHRQYAMSVPFAELLFRLAIRDQDFPGIVGQITANSFMKREFGKKLIEKFLTTVDLTHVIDTSGAYIPGHGTPTVILVANRRYPVIGTVRAVLGIRGEPSAPSVPANGHVWRSIIDNIAAAGTQTEYISVVDLPRKQLSSHPWSLSGGGADELSSILGKSPKRLREAIQEIGFGAVTREDPAYVIGAGTLTRRGVPRKYQRLLVEGEFLRDYTGAQFSLLSIWPYDPDTLEARLHNTNERILWPYRRILSERVAYGLTQLERGLEWYEYSMLFRERYRSPLLIAFAFVATHNHFVLDRGGKVFNRSAPVIKLPDGASENDHLRLLGLLNSSTACFWLKQVSYPKGGDPVGQEGARVSASGWDDRYEFTGTKLQEFPLPDGAPLERARQLDELARELATVTPRAIAETSVPTREALAEARAQWEAIRAEMIAIQEELDWEAYRLYRVLDDDLTYDGGDLPKLALGERAFEIVLARKMQAGEVETEWFNRHRSTPIIEIPEHWPQDYRDLVVRRIELIESHPLLHLIERPECKRRWATRPWEDMQRDALTDWILDRLETEELWRDEHGPRVLSVAQLADLLRGDSDLRSVLTLLTGRPDHDLTAELARLLKDEAVPFLAALRYRESGMRTRAAWEHTWDLQRREDAGENVGDIPVPPKYTSADFRATAYWRHRGKLDVPKERFISYPGSGRDADKTAVIGWAGWDHLQQAQALARLILDRSQQDGWQADQLTPLLAGLAELQPWLHQWHNQLDSAYGGSPAAFYTTFLDEQLQRHGITRQTLTDWRPATTTRRGRPRSLT